MAAFNTKGLIQSHAAPLKSKLLAESQLKQLAVESQVRHPGIKVLQSSHRPVPVLSM